MQYAYCLYIFHVCMNGLYIWCSRQKYKNKLLIKNYGYFVKQKQNITRRMGGADRLIATSPSGTRRHYYNTILA